MMFYWILLHLMQSFLCINIYTITPPYKHGSQVHEMELCYTGSELTEYIPSITMGATTIKKSAIKQLFKANVAMQSITQYAIFIKLQIETSKQNFLKIIIVTHKRQTPFTNGEYRVSTFYTTIALTLNNVTLVVVVFVLFL